MPAEARIERMSSRRLDTSLVETSSRVCMTPRLLSIISRAWLMASISSVSLITHSQRWAAVPVPVTSTYSGCSLSDYPRSPYSKLKSKRWRRREQRVSTTSRAWSRRSARMPAHLPDRGGAREGRCGSPVQVRAWRRRASGRDDLRGGHAGLGGGGDRVRAAEHRRGDHRPDRGRGREIGRASCRERL